MKYDCRFHRTLRVLMKTRFINSQALQLGLVYGKDASNNIVEQLSVCTVKEKFIPHSFEISMLLFFIAPMSVITVLYILIGIKLYKPNLVTPEKRKPILIPAGRRECQQHIVHPDPANYVTHSKSTKRVVKMLGT